MNHVAVRSIFRICAKRQIRATPFPDDNVV